jgi:hypothetical protein
LLYDIPGSKVAQQQILGRFDRIGRTNQLNVYVFATSDSADNITSEPLRLIRETFAFGPEL